ncbi:MAG: LytR/AlgR family response regulator transcription factor [Enterococcus sp.]
MRIFICEDNSTTSLYLKHLCEQALQNISKTNNEVRIYNEEILLISDYQNSDRADLIFLDIELGKLSGIEVAKKIREIDKKVKIIFATNYENYKNEAFSVHAFGYLEKPIQEKEIEKVLSESIQYSSLEDINHFLRLRNAEGEFVIDKNNVLYIENHQRKLKLVCFSEILSLNGKISILSKDLKNFGFESPHVSFLVNLDFVRQIKNYTVYMVNGDELPLSQKKSAVFRKQMSKHIRNIINTYKEEPK